MAPLASASQQIDPHLPGDTRAFDRRRNSFLLDAAPAVK